MSRKAYIRIGEDIQLSEERRFMGRHFLAILLLVSIPLQVGFFGKGYNRATQKDELIFISTEREKKIGASIAKQVEKQFEETDDPLLQKHIEGIGKRIAEACERKDVIYRFKVLKAKREDDYNAFALPGGYVYIFDALLEKLKNDDEIAAILAHETSHIAAKHSIKKLQASIGVNALMLLGVGMGTDSRTFAKAGNALNQLMVSYSREAEVEADKLSVRYVKKAGFNPESVISVLETLQALKKKGPIRRYMYYKTHPYLSERLAKAKIEVRGKMDFDSFINLPEEEENF